MSKLLKVLRGVALGAGVLAAPGVVETIGLPKEASTVLQTVLVYVAWLMKTPLLDKDQEKGLPLKDYNKLIK